MLDYERTLNPKRDIRNFIDMMSRESQKAANYTLDYRRGLLTLEEYITTLFSIEKEMLIEEGFKEQARRSFYED